MIHEFMISISASIFIVCLYNALIDKIKKRDTVSYILMGVAVIPLLYIILSAYYKGDQKIESETNNNIVTAYESENQIVGDSIITSKIVILRDINKNIYVKKNGYLILNRILNGNLYIDKGSTVDINGIVTGNISLNGGNLNINGIVKGKIYNHSGVIKLTDQALTNEIIEK